MAALSVYLGNKLIDALLRAQTFAMPTATYVALYTTNPTTAGGAGAVEATGGSYARAAITSGLTEWAGTQGAGTTVVSSGTASPMATSNNAVVTYPAPTASWGSIVGLGVYDALTGGNLLFYAPLTTPKTVNNGDPGPTFPIGALDFSLA